MCYDFFLEKINKFTYWNLGSFWRIKLKNSNTWNSCVIFYKFAKSKVKWKKFLKNLECFDKKRERSRVSDILNNNKNDKTDLMKLYFCMKIILQHNDHVIKTDFKVQTEFLKYFTCTVFLKRVKIEEEENETCVKRIV